MNKKIKAQVLFAQLEKASINEIKLPDKEAIELYQKRLSKFGTYMFCLAAQGKLFVEQKDKIENKLRAVDPSQDGWLDKVEDCDGSMGD